MLNARVGLRVGLRDLGADGGDRPELDRVRQTGFAEVDLRLLWLLRGLRRRRCG